MMICLQAMVSTSPLVCFPNIHALIAHLSFLVFRKANSNPFKELSYANPESLDISTPADASIVFSFSSFISSISSFITIPLIPPIFY